MDARVTVGMLLFDDVEVLDFAGPYEVFSITRNAVNDEKEEQFRILLFGAIPAVRCRSGLRVTVDHLLAEAIPVLDLLLVPGGPGIHKVTSSEAQLDWLRRAADSAGIVASVCTGALALAAAGLLAGKRATTHFEWLDELGSLSPSTTVETGRRFVIDGKVRTAAGVTAGIDLALDLVAHFLGEPAAWRAAKRMEYKSPPK